jgi:hypothetical protein
MDQQTLIAVLDRIIPADDFPSASQAGVQNYLAHILAREQRHNAAMIEGLIAELAAKNFAQRSADAQDALLKEYETASAFLQLIELVMEGYYAASDAPAWRMIGFRP